MRGKQTWPMLPLMHSLTRVRSLSAPRTQASWGEKLTHVTASQEPGFGIVVSVWDAGWGISVLCLRCGKAVTAVAPRTRREKRILLVDK